MMKEKLVEEFKRSGQFDAIRKRLAEDYASSQSAKRLHASLEEIAANSATRNEAELVGLLTKSELFKQAERELNGKEFLAAPTFKADLRKRLRQIYDKIHEKDTQIQEPIPKNDLADKTIENKRDTKADVQKDTKAIATAIVDENKDSDPMPGFVKNTFKEIDSSADNKPTPS